MFKTINKSTFWIYCKSDLSLQKKAKGAELFDQIMYHLDVVEKDYFGLRFMDSAQVPVRVKWNVYRMYFDSSSDLTDITLTPPPVSHY